MLWANRWADWVCGRCGKRIRKNGRPRWFWRLTMKQLRKLNANLRYMEYHNVDHDVWKRAFAEPELVPWLSSRRRGKPAEGQVGTGAAPANH